MNGSITFHGVKFMENKTFAFWRFSFVLFILCLLTALCAASCAASCAAESAAFAPDEETLLRYTRSQDVYREGRFTEAAGILAGDRKFAPALVLRGKAEYLSGDFSAAEKSLKRALRLKPHDAEASLFLARLLRENGELTEAQRLIEKILGNNPFDIRALRFAAALARERGAAGEAASAALLDRAAEASAESALVFLDRSRIRWSGGNKTGALDDLRRARTLLPDDSPVIKAVEVLEYIISEVSR